MPLGTRASPGRVCDLVIQAWAVFGKCSLRQIGMRIRGQRQGDGEGRPGAARADEVDAAAHRPDELTHQPQADSEADVRLRALAAPEPLEDVRLVGLGDPHAMIAHTKRHRLFRAAEGYFDRSTLAELDRVGQYIVDDLLDGEAIPDAVHFGGNV